MRKLRRDLAHALAAEYVVGTLRGRARQRFEAIAREDASVREVLRAWEDAMTPLVERAPAVEPPARVWRAIDSRIGPAPRARAGLLQSLSFWRSAAAALVVMLAVALLTLGPTRRGAPEPMMVAVLAASDEAPRAVVMQHTPDTIRVRIVKPWGNMDNQNLELWGMDAQGRPRSLGLVANASDRETLIHMPAGSLRDVKAMVVTMEPIGGSPTRQPTGSPVCSGLVAAMHRS